MQRWLITFRWKQRVWLIGHHPISVVFVNNMVGVRSMTVAMAWHRTSMLWRNVATPTSIICESWGTIALSVVVWASYQIRKIAGCACAGNAGNVFPRRRFQRKLLVSDPGMHHGTCVTHVPWCMSGSLTCGDGENVPGIPGACAPAILRIWQDAHWVTLLGTVECCGVCSFCRIVLHMSVSKFVPLH